jgi:hypothetical protein
MRRKLLEMGLTKMMGPTMVSPFFENAGRGASGENLSTKEYVCWRIKPHLISHLVFPQTVKSPRPGFTRFHSFAQRNPF